MENDLGVRGRLADGAGRDQLLAEREGVREIAVVANSEAARVEIGEQRLHVAQDDVAGRRVAVVADGHTAREPLDHARLGEVVADEAEAALLIEAFAVIGDDAAAFLAAMLERVHAERGDGGGIIVTEDAENAALLAEAVAIPICFVGLQRVGVVRVRHGHHRCGSIAAG